MSILHEIQNQSPAVRRTLFVLSVVVSVSAIAFVTISSIQQDVYFALHPDPTEQQAFLDERNANQPQPVAMVARLVGGMLGNIGSLIGWNSNAGFDSTAQPSNTQGGVHLLPIAQ